MSIISSQETRVVVEGLASELKATAKLLEDQLRQMRERSEDEPKEKCPEGHLVTPQRH